MRIGIHTEVDNISEEEIDKFGVVLEKAAYKAQLDMLYRLDDKYIEGMFLKPDSKIPFEGQSVF